MLSRFMLVFQVSIQNLHHDTSKHTYGGQIGTYDVYRGNGQVLCSLSNPGFSFKGMMAMHGSTEDTMSDMPQSVSRKPHI